LFLSNVIYAEDTIKASQFPYLKYYAFSCMGISQLASQPENLKDLLWKKDQVS